MQVKNPILPGFYPDPSMCAVGGDYYIVNSTFSYFPGLPVFHSKDLAHWEQIGNAMDRKSQLPLAGCRLSEGLFAPTIRYHEGKYYIICTNIVRGGNYIITADQPEGPWSEPYYLGEQAPGIDPSLFFDDDGTSYYIGTCSNPYGARYYGDNYIWIQKIDLKAMKMLDSPYYVWNGAMRDIPWPEGPHLYKKDGYYYITYAEGGTGPHHSVCVIRSRKLGGPYENNFCNPIITHRAMGKKYPVQYVGHSDMIEAADGKWYMIMLAVRPKNGYTNLGRETFLANVTWEEGWPVINPMKGILTDEVEVTLPVWNPEKDSTSYTARSKYSYTQPGMNKSYDFTKMAMNGIPLGHEFLSLREPDDNMYELSEKTGCLRVRPCTDKITECKNAAYLGIRQSHHRFNASVMMNIANMEEGTSAGFILMQNDKYQIRMEYNREMVCLIQVTDGAETVLKKNEIDKIQNTVVLSMSIRDDKAAFSCDGALLMEDIDIHELSTEVAGGFVGCTLGMYAQKEIADADSQVDFLSFIYTAE